MQLNETLELNYLLLFLTIAENMGTHEKKSGDSTKSSEILFFPIKIKQTLFQLEELTGYFDIALL